MQNLVVDLLVERCLSLGVLFSHLVVILVVGEVLAVVH
jgi:hypothetical protein